MSPKAKTAPLPSKETPVYTDNADHLTGVCDNCGDTGAFAYCVTSSKTHLHACRKDGCKDALEKRLHG